MLRSYRGVSPCIAPSAYVDPGATVIGDVTIGEHSSVWPSASIRGDISPIRIGDETNIQDGCVLHSDEGIPLTLGNRVTVGHSVVLHGCTIEDDAVIGIGAIVLNHARIGAGAVVAAGALAPEGMEIPPGMLAMGMPAKVRRPVNAEEQERFREGVRHYAERADTYRSEL
jgi:carbonic anhydrase/acetyltransferase-like protein (isoleucine patch superfamily)